MATQFCYTLLRTGCFKSHYLTRKMGRISKKILKICVQNRNVQIFDIQNRIRYLKYIEISMQTFVDIRYLAIFIRCFDSIFRFDVLLSINIQEYIEFRYSNSYIERHLIDEATLNLLTFQLYFLVIFPYMHLACGSYASASTKENKYKLSTYSPKILCVYSKSHFTLFL